MDPNQHHLVNQHLIAQQQQLGQLGLVAPTMMRTPSAATMSIITERERFVVSSLAWCCRIG
jgi:hypothetical protein